MQTPGALVKHCFSRSKASVPSSFHENVVSECTRERQYWQTGECIVYNKKPDQGTGVPLWN